MTDLEQNKTERSERALPRGIRLRRGTGDDEFATFEVMRRAMGYDMNWTHHAAARYHLRTVAHSSFWVAEEIPRFGKHKIVGYARSLVREGVWNLTEFFLLPDYQRRGIGGALLQRSLDDSVVEGADTRFVLASQHPAADALYVRRAGCIPRLPMFLLAGPLTGLRAHAPGGLAILDTIFPQIAREASGGTSAGQPVTETLRAEPILLTAETQSALDTLDRAIVGYARAPEHSHWTATMGGPERASRLFRRQRIEPSGVRTPGPIVGYAYLGAHASGPALAVEPTYLPAFLAHVAALSLAVDGASAPFASGASGEQYLALAGTNEVTLRWLLDCGWHIVFQYLFMSSRPLGQLDRYIGYNPLYVL